MKTRGACLFGVAALAIGCGKVKDSSLDDGGVGPACKSRHPCGAMEGGAALDGHAPTSPGDGGAAGAGGRGNGGGSPQGMGGTGAPSTSDGGGFACPGTQVSIDGHCVVLGTVAPCSKSPSSGFPGDGQCIEAPAATTGMQLHYGPKDYTDPDEVAKFTLAPGESNQQCMFMKTPNANAVHVKEWHARVRPGAYEAILYESDTQVPDSPGPEPCAKGSANANSLVSVAGTDLDLSMDGGAPEFAGAGERIDAHTQVFLSVNMWNTTDAPLLVEAWLNGVYSQEPVQREVAPITWFGGLALNVAPHSTHVVRAGGSGQNECRAPSDQSVIALVGSTGAHTTRMTAYVQRSGTMAPTRIYESYDWSAPVRLYYDSVVRNPVPDARSSTTGGVSGLLTLHPGDTVSWECAIDNSTDASLTYSDNPFAGELCNFYGLYAAGTEPWLCFSP